MALLQQQMTRYYEGMRPRFSNPTYASTNVGSTLGMHVPFIYRSIRNNFNADVKSNSLQNLHQLPQARFAERRGSSQLSNIGINSLKPMSHFISDKQVFQRQQKNYNIISVQPREYQDTIKLFPKYRLQNQDQNYYKRMQLERDFANKLHANKEQVKNVSSINPERISKPMRGKYLNTVDEVKDMI